MKYSWAAWGVGLISVFAGCGVKESPPAALGHAVLKEWPAVPWGTPIDPDSVLISIDADGKTYRNGRPQPLAEMLELLKKPPKGGGLDSQVNTDPILLEVHPALHYCDLVDMFSALVEKACRVNIAFLVSTHGGPRGLVLPVLVSHGCDELIFYDGRSQSSGLGPSKRQGEGHLLWIDARPGAAGSIRVVSLRLDEPYDTIEYPQDPANKASAIPRSPAKDRNDWKGDHPPLGEWPLESLLKLMADPRLGKPGAFVLLKVQGSDRMTDVLYCLSAVKAAMGSKILPELEGSWTAK
jgi:biopolymer transport protein ExbD